MRDVSQLRRYEDAMQRLQQQFEDDVERLALEFHREVVVPACKRLKLIFLSGNGVFFFCKEGAAYNTPLRNISTEEDAKDAHRESLIPILRVLNMEVSKHAYFGFYVPDVRDPPDKQE